MGEELETREQQSALVAAGARVDETSLVFTDPASLTWDHFEDLARHFLAPIGRGYPWWVGDMLNMAEDVLGEKFAQLEAYFPHSPQTLANYKSVAKHMPKSRRRGLHLTVAAEVAYLPPKQRDELVDQAVKGDWKREEMREARRAVAIGDGRDVLPPASRKRCPHCGHALED
ncbi:MAG TPA: hypothetical protein VLA89_00030 [Gemmatimonadales bacterium]|nr:hypothetical protein [Gemmatimonadales bacterium]